MNEAAATGCLVGTAVGDALGLPYEGLSKQSAAKLFGAPSRHRFLFRRGMVSDDTEHTCMVAQALIRSAGDPNLFVREMAKRLRCWFLLLPAGVGLATARACLKLLLGFSAENSGVFSAGNGPAMRSALLGVYCEDVSRLQELVSRNTRITHTDPKAEFGALSIALAAHLAKEDRDVEPGEYLSILKRSLQKWDAAEYLELAEHAVQSVERQESTLEFAEKRGLVDGVGGYVYHCVPVVIHCWLNHQTDFRRAVTTIIQCGGDTDTNAAMVGGIVGARVGVMGIPREWTRNLIDWPISVTWMISLARQLSEVSQSGVPRNPTSRFWGLVFLRNLFFLMVVLFHGFRRLFPPY